jgi:U6 snRNA-associated Sm-like protein LSm8
VQVEVIRVITTDGRTLQGELLSIDNQTNILLTNALERVIETVESEKANDVHHVGTYLVRGDLVLVCGLVDEEMDDDINWMDVKGGPIGTTKHI